MLTLVLRLDTYEQQGAGEVVIFILDRLAGTAYLRPADTIRRDASDLPHWIQTRYILVGLRPDLTGPEAVFGAHGLDGTRHLTGLADVGAPIDNVEESGRPKKGHLPGSGSQPTLVGPRASKRVLPCV